MISIPHTHTVPAPTGGDFCCVVVASAATTANYRPSANYTNYKI